MRIIGLSGGIGAGKSTVAGFLRRRGAVIIDADTIAREILAPGSPWLEEVVKEFGSQILLPDGSLNRPRLAQSIFADKNTRARLNAICHPPIVAEISCRLEELRASDSPPAVVIVVAPLLFEAGAETLVEKVIVVVAEEKERLRRLKESLGLSEEEIRARFAAQLPWDSLELPAGAGGSLLPNGKRVDWVIDNSGDLSSTECQVEALWQELTRH